MTAFGKGGLHFDTLFSAAPTEGSIREYTTHLFLWTASPAAGKAV